jgi:hypothetical protein
MADTFASFAHKVDKFQHELTDDALGHAIGKMAKDEAKKAADADIGDASFSGWTKKSPIKLDTAYDIVGPGRVSFHPKKRSAGPWTVAEFGRNTAAGPAIGGKGKRGSRRRWNGRTKGKGTATDALNAIEPKVPKLAEQQVARAIRKVF